MSKTKIVEIIESLSDGGAQSIVKDYACLINKDEFDIVIYTIYPCEYSANYRQVVDAGVKIVSVYESYGLISKVLNRLYKRKYIVKRLRSFLNIFLQTILKWLPYMRKQMKLTDFRKLFQILFPLTQTRLMI